MQGDSTTDESRWNDALGELGPQLIQRLAAYLPNVLAAVALLAFVYVLAVLARVFIRRIVAVAVENRLSSIMQRHVAALRPNLDLGTLALHSGWKDYDALPGPGANERLGCPDNIGITGTGAAPPD